MNSISENIKKIRLERNFTQDELAEKLSVTRQAVSNWENGKTEPDIGTIENLSKILSVTPNELINGENKNSPKPLSKKKLIFSLSFIIFAAVSLLAFEIISPIMQDYVSKYYDYRFYYLIVGIWKPIAIVLGTCGILSLLLSFLNIKIKNRTLKKIVFITGILSLSVIFVSNVATCVLMFYTYHGGSGVSTYIMNPAFFMMKHQILYIVPAILLTLGASEKST